MDREPRSRAPLLSVSLRSMDRGGSQASAWDCHGGASGLQVCVGVHADPERGSPLISPLLIFIISAAQDELKPRRAASRLISSQQ